MQALDPVTISSDASGNPIAAAIELPANLQIDRVKLQNLTNLPMRVRIGGLQDWLGPLIGRTFPCRGSYEVLVQPRAILPVAPSATLGAILPTVFSPGEAIPDLGGAAAVSVPTVTPGSGDLYASSYGGLHPGGLNRVVTLSVPAGAQSLVVTAIPPGSGTMPQLQLAGQTTGRVYLNETPAAPLGPLTLELDPNDTVVVLTDYNQNTSTGTLYVSASPSPAPGTPGPASPASGNVTLNGGASATIVSGVAGQLVRLYSLRAYTETAAGVFVAFQDTTGVNVGRGTANAPVQAFAGEYSGAPLAAAGRGLQLANFGGSAGILDWTAVFAQGWG